MVNAKVDSYSINQVYNLHNLIEKNDKRLFQKEIVSGTNLVSLSVTVHTFFKVKLSCCTSSQLENTVFSPLIC